MLFVYLGMKIVFVNLRKTFFMKIKAINSSQLIKILIILIFGINTGAVQAQFEHSGAYYCSQRKINANFKLNTISEKVVKHTFDVLHYDINLDLFACYTTPYPKNFNASCKIRIAIDSSITNIILDASSYSLIINSIDSPAISFVHSNNKLAISLNQMYNPGDNIELMIRYQHKNLTDGAFYASGGFVFTDCEPQGARKWFPCYDRPSDKATLRLQAKTPLGVLLGSNGKLLSNNVISDSIFYIWQSRDPIATYLMVITSKMNYNLDIIQWKNPLNQSDSFPIWFYYNNGEDITYSKSLILQVTNCFTEKFGPHPFEKNGFATLNSDFTWGGMENQTLTSLCPGCWIEVLLVHEYAHQWFGDMITCAAWSDLWLNEGFATYCEALWYEYKHNYTYYHNTIVAKANYYLNNNPGWPVYNAAWATNPPQNDTLFNGAITYYKGCCVLHMLRYLLGDVVFFDLLREYATDAVNFRYKSATTQDFMDKVNAITGENYDWFFEQWIFNPNHPVYQNTYAINHNTTEEWSVIFNAKQVQSNTVFYKMPVEIKIVFQDNTDTLVKVMNDSNYQSFIFVFDKQPQHVVFDPNNNIVLKAGSTVNISNISKSDVLYFDFEILPNVLCNQSGKIVINATKTIQCNIKLYDESGRQLSAIFDGEINSSKYEIPLITKDLKSGSYAVVLFSENMLQVKRFFVLN